MGYRFRLHRKDLPGTPDLALMSLQKAIFVHGCFWHGHRCKRGRPPSTNTEFWREKVKQNRIRDNRAKRALRRAHWNYLVVWECELRDEYSLKQKLKMFLDSNSKDAGNHKE
jgi:DNA mismatch endonuclease (patch repair protein)